MRRLATLAAAAVLTMPFAANASAQDTPRSCGGLLCDMGVFGRSGSASSALPCNDFLCRALGGKQAEAAPPPPPAPAAVAPLPPEPAPVKHRKKKRAAKMDAVQSETAKSAAAPAADSAPK